MFNLYQGKFIAPTAYIALLVTVCPKFRFIIHTQDGLLLDDSSH